MGMGMGGGGVEVFRGRTFCGVVLGGVPRESFFFFFFFFFFLVGGGGVPSLGAGNRPEGERSEGERSG